MGRRFNSSVSDGEIVAGESLRAVLVAAAVLIAVTLPAAAQDATWNLNGTGDYNSNGNWTPNVPSGTAFFGVSNQNAVTFSNRVTTIGGWTFNAGASAYTFTTSSASSPIFPLPALTFTGAGIVINGGSATINNNYSLGSVNFNNTSTAGSATINNNSNLGVNFNNSSTAGSAAITNAGTVNFNNTSTAGSAAITNTGTVAFRSNSTAASAAITGTGGVEFFNASTAASAAITSTGSGSVQFFNTSTAANAAITSTGSGVQFFDTSTAASATITSTGFGPVQFFNASTAASAAITNTGFGPVQFFNTSTAASASITSTGQVQFFDTSTGGSAAITSTGAGFQFFNTSTGGSAALTSTGTGGFSFLDTSTAGNAAITNSGSGNVDFSNSTGPNNDHKLSAGSIAGGGFFLLGANQLTVGGNNLSTVVSGIIRDSFGAATGGALVKIGTGALTLAGTNTYTGGTTVNGGTLQIGNGGTTGSIVGDVIDNATLAFNRSDTLTFGGAISGSGALQQMGPGTLVLTGTKTYTGGTTVNGGTLEVDGSIATSSLTTVNGGAALTGTGTVSATQINSGGTLAPGNAANPTGTLNIAGNLALASSAIYMVQISPTAASMANVSGTATLNGTLEAVFAPGAPGTYLTRRYDVLHATAVNGTFAAVTGINTPIGLFNLVYTATDVFLDFIASIGGDGTPLNGNQQAVASSINNVLNSGGALPPGFVPLFTLGGTSLQTALSHLDGEAAADAQKGSFALMTEFLSLMLDPFVDGRSGSSGTGATPFAPEQQSTFPPDIALAYNAILKAPPPQSTAQRWTAWGAGFGGYNKTNGDPTAGSNTVTAHDFGFAAGMDYHFLPNSLVGFSLAGGGTNWGLAQGLGGGRSDAFSGGLYAKTRSGPWYVAAALAVADQWFSTSRTAAFGDQLTARFNGQSVGGRVEAGYRYAAAPMIGVTPYAALQAQSFHTPRYSETDVTAGGFGLTYNDMSASDTRSELGARFDDLTMLGAMPLVLRARAAWAHDAVSNPALGAVFQTLPGAGFIVNGAAPPKNSALASAGAELRMTKTWSLAAKFDGEFASRAQTYAGTGTLRYQW